jgi:hypothetical protein
MTTHPYLLDRGFSSSTITELGWRIEPLGDRWRYLHDEDAAEALAWFIPYDDGYERFRLIDAADVDRFDGRYRGPKGKPLRLYDPRGVVDTGGVEDGVVVLDAALAVEGEANAASVLDLVDLPVVGLPGQNLTDPMAHTLGGVATVYLWLDPGPNFQRVSRRAAERLYAAGVLEVWRVGPTEQDANALLVELGPELLGELLEGCSRPPSSCRRRAPRRLPPRRRVTCGGWT